MKRSNWSVVFTLGILLSFGARAQIFITHAQTGYDSEQVSKKEIQKIIANQKQTIYFLENNKDQWFIDGKNNKIEWIDSQFGEHKVRVENNQVIIMGHNTGACLQHTFIDILKYYQGDKILNVHLPLMATVTTAGTISFGEELKDFSKEEKQERIFFYFNRHESYYERNLPKHAPLGSKWSHIKIAYYLNGEYLAGSKKPEVILWSWENSKDMENHLANLKSPE